MTRPTGFASRTSVSVDRSQVQIGALLRKRGATNIAFGTRDDDRPPMAWVAFRIERHSVLVKAPLPERHELKHTGGRKRTEAQVIAELEQRARSLWRALLLSLQARFASIDAGLSSAAREFLPNLDLGGGRTIGDLLLIPIVQGELPKVAGLLEGIGG